MSEFLSTDTTSSPLMDYLQESLSRVWKQRKSLKTIRTTPKDHVFCCSNERRMGARSTLCGDFPLAIQIQQC